MEVMMFGDALEILMLGLAFGFCTGFLVGALTVAKYGEIKESDRK